MTDTIHKFITEALASPFEDLDHQLRQMAYAETSARGMADATGDLVYRVEADFWKAASLYICMVLVDRRGKEASQPLPSEVTPLHRCKAIGCQQPSQGPDTWCLCHADHWLEEG